MILEAKIHQVMERLANNESDQLEIKREWIDEAVEMVREGLERQLFREQEPFRVRMSNISKPTCQLQMEKAGTPKTRMPYNHIMRMMHGDMIEAIMQLVLRISGANITGGKNKVKLNVAGTEVRGEDDIEIDHKVFDTKSASPWAFKNKWSEGFAGLKKSDDFGYIGQLVGYSVAQKKEPGGWIVVDKSSGEVKVVEVDLTKKEVKGILGDMKSTVKALDGDFKRCFEPEDETFRRKPTGSKRLSTTCGFCSFTSSCWPNAKLLPQTGSQAKSPRHYWYTEYEGEKL
mgnify:FL=1